MNKVSEREVIGGNDSLRGMHSAEGRLAVA